MRIFKKICAAVIAVLLLSSGNYISQGLVSVPVIAVETDPAFWESTADISWYDAKETRFHIKNQAQLVGFLQLVKDGNTMENKIFYLDEDITMPDVYWAASGTFSGTFDGLGHSISGLHAINGLFSSLGETAVVRNLNLKGISVSGRVAGSVCSENYGRIVRCFAYGSISGTGSVSEETSGAGDAAFVGGICGKNYGSIAQCKNQVAVSGHSVHNSTHNGYASAYAGGIAGNSSGDISESVNEGSITGEGISGCYAGGIAAASSGTIINVYNTGKVYTLNSLSPVDIYSGGILASGKTVINAYNIGSVSSDGISGYGHANDIGIVETITNCYTTSDISSKEMQTMKFAETLGEAFAAYADGNYPKLLWEFSDTLAEEETETETEPQTETESETEPEKQSLKLTEYTETATLHVNYDGDIVWLSSNPKVATVKDGIVTAIGNGSAVIYAVCGDQRVETPVEVSYDYYLDHAELNLEKDSQYQLGFYSANTKEAYNQLAVWSSSDESVITVDEVGIITAISAGTAEVTAKAGDVTVSCTITVKTADQPEISAQQMIQEGESTVLSVSGYNGSVTWVSSDTEIADISADGTLTGIKAGTTDIYAMLDNGKTISIKITVTSAESLLGDANLDGNINILDVIIINRAVLGKENLSAEQIKASDINKNNIPDSIDSLTIMKFIVGLVTALE